MAFIQERRIVIPHGMVVFPSEVSLLLVSHSSCLWVRIRKHLTHHVGCDKYCYSGCPSYIGLLSSICHIQTDGNSQRNLQSWIVMLKIRPSLFLFSGGDEIAGVRMPSFANSAAMWSESENPFLWQWCWQCGHNQRIGPPLATMLQSWTQPEKIPSLAIMPQCEHNQSIPSSLAIVPQCGQNWRIPSLAILPQCGENWRIPSLAIVLQCGTQPENPIFAILSAAMETTQRIPFLAIILQCGSHNHRIPSLAVVQQLWVHNQRIPSLAVVQQLSVHNQRIPTLAILHQWGHNWKIPSLAKGSAPMGP